MDPTLNQHTAKPQSKTNQKHTFSDRCSSRRDPLKKERAIIIRHKTYINWTHSDLIYQRPHLCPECNQEHNIRLSVHSPTTMKIMHFTFSSQLPTQGLSQFTNKSFPFHPPDFSFVIHLKWSVYKMRNFGLRTLKKMSMAIYYRFFLKT